MIKTLLCGAVFLFLLLGTSIGLEAVDDGVVTEVTQQLLELHGGNHGIRIRRGVTQAAALWRPADGSPEDFRTFCLENFVAADKDLAVLRDRLESACESLYGHFNQLNLELKAPMQLDMGPMHPVDMKLGSLSPGAHLTDDLFAGKIAFMVLLNFPTWTLREKITHGPGWTTDQWADARMGDMFRSRVPAAVYQSIGAAMTTAEAYISDYNIHMDHLVNGDGKHLFPAGLKLITHWGLRDELKSRYADPEGPGLGLTRQRVIYAILNRIITQEIPRKVIDNGTVDWDPVANRVFEDGREIRTVREPDTRYQRFLEVFRAFRGLDPYFPALPSHVARRFEMDREIPEEEVEAVFARLCASEEVRRTAGLISRRLGRPLEPFDIWYNGFKSQGGLGEARLDAMVAERYPDAAAFQADIPRILKTLGFSTEQVEFIAPRIEVDASRGAGHAAGSAMRSAKARLRTRVPEGGMTYKGYNIAVHELGHCVEQTLTLHKVPRYMLNGVPNTACTEAFAFVFQSRDLELLGIEPPAPGQVSLKVLDTLWNAYEIMGPSLVDMKVWNWLYKNPDATPGQLKKAVLEIAGRVWNRYYADVFGVRDLVILAAYSHMIESALYLPDYPLGHLMEFQIESFLKGRNLGTEMERMCATGRVIPQLWMRTAVGEGISEKPLLQAAATILNTVEKKKK